MGRVPAYPCYPWSLFFAYSWFPVFWSGSGYSGKPLAQKLGLKSGKNIVAFGAPPITVAEDKMHEASKMRLSRNAETRKR